MFQGIASQSSRWLEDPSAPDPTPGKARQRQADISDGSSFGSPSDELVLPAGGAVECPVAVRQVEGTEADELREVPGALQVRSAHRAQAVEQGHLRTPAIQPDPARLAF